ncbi:hypothetical protein EVAR_38377_1 [Eumeta japonica]|uniref:Uncharacterized protein n=1 Tax=Eumeta variegata TaxID=151549 RepID=A0A4C1Y020_EUMVA|nr:hypothetical protein EVAR_38377_1 [Eumeta japonica]
MLEKCNVTVLLDVKQSSKGLTASTAHARVLVLAAYTPVADVRAVTSITLILKEALSDMPFRWGPTYFVFGRVCSNCWDGAGYLS